MKRNVQKFVAFFLIWFIAMPTYAYEASTFVKITKLRPGIGGNVYIEVDTASAMCGTSAFLLKVTDVATQAVYSSILTAAISGKQIQLETWGPCAPGDGWGTEIQSVVVLF